MLEEQAAQRLPMVLQRSVELRIPSRRLARVAVALAFLAVAAAFQTLADDVHKQAAVERVAGHERHAARLRSRGAALRLRVGDLHVERVPSAHAGAVRARSPLPNHAATADTMEARRREHASLDRMVEDLPQLKTTRALFTSSTWHTSLLHEDAEYSGDSALASAVHASSRKAQPFLVHTHQPGRSAEALSCLVERHEAHVSSFIPDSAAVVHVAPAIIHDGRAAACGVDWAVPFTPWLKIDPLDAAAAGTGALAGHTGPHNARLHAFVAPHVHRKESIRVAVEKLVCRYLDVHRASQCRAGHSCAKNTGAAPHKRSPHAPSITITVAHSRGDPLATATLQWPEALGEASPAALPECERIAAAALAAHPAVEWVEAAPVVTVQNYWTSRVLESGNGSDTSRGRYIARDYHVDGSGEIVGVGDTGVDVASCFFSDDKHPVQLGVFSDAHRKIAYYEAGRAGNEIRDAVDGHGTHVAGSIAGAAPGGTFASDFNGVAPGARLAIMDLAHGDEVKRLNTPDHIARDYFNVLYGAGRARVISSSWGQTNGRNVYSLLAYETDRFAYEHPDALLVFAAGNTGAAGAFSVLNPCLAKNTLCVGATQSDMASFYDSALGFPLLAVREHGTAATEPWVALGRAAAFGPRFILAPSVVARGQLVDIASDGCSDLDDKVSSMVSGRIALVRRGACTFASKAVRIAHAGALALVVANTDESLPLMTVDVRELATLPSGQPAIPSVIVTASTAAHLQAAAASGANVSLGLGAAVDLQAGASFRSVHSPRNVPWFSARGPAFDGRLKPDILAPGQYVWSARSTAGQTRGCGSSRERPDYAVRASEGTSMATPITAGAAALLRDALRRGHYVRVAAGSPVREFRPTAESVDGVAAPTGALLRTMLIASSAPVAGSYLDQRGRSSGVGGAPGALQGHGAVRLARVLPPRQAASQQNVSPHVFVAEHPGLATSENVTFCFALNVAQVAAAAKASAADPDSHDGSSLVAAIAWDDPPASAASSIALVNDLDLVVHVRREWKGRVESLVFMGNADRVHGAPSEVPDTLNNAEVVRVPLTAVLDGSPKNVVVSVVVRGAHVLGHYPTPPLAQLLAANVPAGKSCNGRCVAGKSLDGSCACDAPCRRFGDCCADADRHCPPPDPLAGIQRDARRQPFAFTLRGPGASLIDRNCPSLVCPRGAVSGSRGAQQECSGRGTCKADGACLCDPPFWGIACTERAIEVTRDSPTSGTVAVDGWRVYVFRPPKDAKRVRVSVVKTGGGRLADPDWYIRANEPPTPLTFDAKSILCDTCDATPPERTVELGDADGIVRVWYVAVTGYGVDPAMFSFRAQWDGGTTGPECQKGYVKVFNESAATPFECIDIDECAQRTDNCNQAVATCENVPGSFRCVCRSSSPPKDALCDPPSTSFCGNGRIDSDEECDPGSAAKSDHCCDASTCKFRQAGTVCRNASGPCDASEVCDGKSAACAADALARAGTVCRNASGPCDAPEVCDGKSAACPADALARAGTECRNASGPCDAPEVCDGKSAACPADALARAGTECRNASGPCDASEVCDGKSAACPADALARAGTVCRNASGPCDAPEVCDGKSAACPADALARAGTVCRNASGPCDAPEVCDGKSAACPADAFKEKDIVCAPSKGPCGVEGRCSGRGPACIGEGSVRPAYTECRPAAGPCDVPELCDGKSAACPADKLLPARHQCSPPRDVCEKASRCDGQSPACPEHALREQGFVCRPAVSTCDEPEACTGNRTDCPADQKSPVGKHCTFHNATLTGPGVCIGGGLCAFVAPPTAPPSGSKGPGEGEPPDVIAMLLVATAALGSVVLVLAVVHALRRCRERLRPSYERVILRDDEVPF